MFKALKSILIGGSLAITFGFAADVVTQATIDNKDNNKKNSPIELPEKASDFAALLAAGAAAYAYGRSQGNKTPKP